MSNVRKNPRSIRVTNDVYAKLQMEAHRLNVTLSDVVDGMLPGYRMEPCRYCQRLTRQPTQKHRWHSEDCVLFVDKDLRETPAAGVNRKSDAA